MNQRGGFRNTVWFGVAAMAVSWGAFGTTMGVLSCSKPPVAQLEKHKLEPEKAVFMIPDKKPENHLRVLEK